MYADILLPLPLKATFTYGVPIEWQEKIKIGQRVEVSFGRGKMYSGIVKNVHNQKPEGYTIKPIKNIIDTFPIVTKTQLELWEWMADYYMCAEGEVMNASLPAYLKLESEQIISLNEEAEIDERELSDEEFILIEALRSKLGKKK
jgi:primosomal protein N' (replication factor Y)